MNSENDSQKNNNLTDALEADQVSSIDDFIKELEAKEKDLQLSYDDTVVQIEEAVVQIEESDIESDELAELERLLEAYEANPPIQVENSPVQLVVSQPDSGSLSVLESEISNLRTELSKSEQERAEMIESFRRRQNDFENFRKRIERERNETHRNILSGLATHMLPVVDNLNRALDSASGHEAGKSADFQQFIQGIVLVNHQLNEVLEEIGVHPILAVGEPFDPHFHEAVATEQTDEVPPNTVIAELIRGYKIEETVIRPAMVKVSSAANSETSTLLEIE